MHFPQDKNSFLGNIMALLATILWAGNFIAAKLFTMGFSTFEINFWRWLIASCLMFPLCLPHLKKDWPLVKEQYKFLLYYGFVGVFLSNACFYEAPNTAPAIDMTLIMATSPIMMMLFARLIFKDAINKVWVLGSVLCFLGVATLVTKGNLIYITRTEFTEGHFWILAAAALFALYSVCFRLLKAQVHLTVFLFIIFLLGSIFSFVAMFLFGHDFKLHDYPEMFWPLLYMASLASVGAFLLWNNAVKKIGAVRAGIIYYLIPVFGTAFAVILLDEKINSMQIVGGSLVFAGVISCSFAKLRK